MPRIQEVVAQVVESEEVRDTRGGMARCRDCFEHAPPRPGAGLRRRYTWPDGRTAGMADRGRANSISGGAKNTAVAVGGDNQSILLRLPGLRLPLLVGDVVAIQFGYVR